MDKRSSRRAELRAKRVALAVAAAFLPWAEGHALPTGEEIVTPGVSVTRPTTQSMQIHQGTLQKGIVNWQGFSIGATELVNVVQPNASAALLNRVVGNSPSEIFGRLTANGQVFLVNNAGVLFAPGASVEVGSLLASTLSITDQNFLNGTYQFYNPGNAGSVVNQGSIVTAGGYTALIGPQVQNDGVIIANAGKVALGAGDRISLDIVGDGLLSISVDQAALDASVVNTGTLQADNGSVLLKARSMNALLDTVINTSGVLRASGLGLQNGEIVLHGGDAGTVQISGLVQAESGRIEIDSGGPLNVGATVCCSPTTVIAANQDIEAGSITVGGGSQIIGNSGTGTQTITTPGTLLVRGGIQSGTVGIFHNGSGEQRISAGNLELRGGTGANTGAFINSTGGGDQHITVPGTIAVTGGAGGTASRAGIVANASQTIDGNPDIVLTGGAGGGVGNASNNVFLQGSTDAAKLQRINARTIAITAGAGADAAATINAARQEISTTGNVSLLGGAGSGPVNGVRIGGAGGSILGPTNLTLNVGGSLLLRGGTANGASLGSSGASTAASNITVTAAGDINLESQGGGARIGTGNLTPLPAGNITVTAGSLANPLGGSLNVGAGTAIRANGPITLNANSLTNAGTITNGGGNQNIILNANAFSLSALSGSVQGGTGAVILRPRDGTRSFGIEAAGDTTLTNADLARISTSNFIVLGSGMGTTFTGNMTIGDSAPVSVGGKNLAFFRSAVPGGTTTIGSHGVTTTGDVIISAGGGAIVNGGGAIVSGTVGGDDVQLRAAQGIGTSDAPVKTAANVLAINNTGGAGSFVSELDDITLRTVTLNVGGNINTIGNAMNGALDLQVGGALNVAAAGPFDAIVSSFGGQTITAQSVNVTARDGRIAQLLNTGFGEQHVTAGSIDVETSLGGGLAEIRNNSAGSQTLTVLGGHLEIKGLGGGSAAVFGAGNQTVDMVGGGQITLGDHAALGQSLLSCNGDQTISGNADLTLIGGSGPIANASNALITANNATRTQTINAGTLTMENSKLGGNSSVAAILGANQVITTTGDVIMTANASGGALPGVRIGGLGGGGAPATATNLMLNVGRDLRMNGGTVAGNGVGIGSTAAQIPAPANNITINALHGNVILETRAAGAGVRIGSSITNIGTGQGNITINAGGDIRLNGVPETTAIRTLDTVTLNAANISEAAKGTIIAGALNTTTGGSTLLSGPNEIARFNGTSGGALTLVDGGALQVTGIATTNDPITLTTGSLTNSGTISNGGNANMVFNADAFNLAGGTIDAGAAAVILRPRTGTNSFGIEAAGQTTLTNADIASIHTGDFVVFGSGMGTTFTGNMTIGQNAQVNGGGKHLAFFRSTNPGGSTTIGSQGVATTGDLIVSAGGGAILSNGGTVRGDEVHLRASQGVGTPGARVRTDANALAVNNTGGLGSAFVSEAGDVVLRNVNLTIGGIPNNFGNFVGNGASYDVAANGGLTVENVLGTSNGFITLTAASLANAGVISNGGGSTGVVVLIADAFNLAGGTIAGGNAGVVIRPRTGANSFGIEASGQTTLTNADIDSISTTNFVVLGSFLGTNFTGDMTVGENAQVNGGTKNLAFVRSNLAPGTLTIGSQGVTSAGDVMIGAGGGAIVSGSGTVRGDEVQLTAAQDIGAPFARVQTAANALAVNTAGAASVSEADSVTLRTVALNVGGFAQVFGNSVGGAFDLGAGGSVEVAGPVSSGVMSVSASGAITESPSGSITANTLTTFSGGSILLTGPNRIANFSASSMSGEVTLNNTGALDVSSLSAFNAALTNQGDVTVSGPWNSFGTSITTTGLGSDLTVNNVVTANGALNVNVAGDIAVTAGGTQDAMLRSFGGQTISGRSLAVTSNDGRFAAVWNTGPNAQTINLSNGAGLDVQTLSPGGFAQISADAGASQTINVVNGDHINVNGASGAAMISNFGGAQTLSITGGGANAITLGAPGALGPSQVFGGVQSVIAGTGAESGSITIVGGNGNATFTGFSSGQLIGGTQSVSTSGTLRIAGGNAPNQPPSGFATGLFHNGSGQQTVSAANIEMQGGSIGLNNVAIIISSGGAGTIPAGNQVINASGNLELAGGSGGRNNTAIIVSFADQTVSAGSVELTGGTSGLNSGAFINIAGAGPAGSQSLNIAGDLDIAGGAGGNAGITGSATLQQTISADSISLTNSASGGINSVGFILGGHQEIHAAGDVTLTGRASGGDLPGVRIGGTAGTNPSATDLRMFIGGDLVLTGGTAANNGVGIGSTAAVGAPPLENNITINAQGSVILNSGVAGSGARIGSPQTSTGSGNISINAGGDIDLNGADEFATIRTLGTVTLNSASIREVVNGRVIAGSLITNTSGNALLTGPNRVANFSGSSFGGDVTLNNSGALNVTSMNAGNATLTNSGDVSLGGFWNSLAATSITTTGPGSDLNVNTFVQSNGPMTLNVDGAVRVAASGTQGVSLTSFAGQNITARSLEVSSRDGQFASIGNNGSGSQTIAISGGAIDVESVSGNGFAFITQAGTGNQTITVSDGAGLHVRTVSGSGSGQINNFGPGNQVINVSGGGGVEVATLAGTGFALISNAGTGNQTISVAGGSGIDVASAGGFANISNSATGSQSIVVTGGEGIDVLANGGSAGIQQTAAGFAQTVTAIDADHIKVNAVAGNASINSGGLQTISITGAGVNNALIVGSAGAQGRSNIGGARQMITAGASSEPGRIDIFGVDAPSSFAGITTNFAPGAGNTQTISTSGNITVLGGNAPSQFLVGTPPVLTTSNAGIFHNSNGAQTINAADITLRGGPSGLNNGVFIGSNGGGDQFVTVPGAISITGGAGGDNNRALILGNGNQTISGNPHIALTGGSGSGEIGNNGAFIIANAPAKTQTIHAAGITVSAGDGGINNSAGITGTKQFITTTGDVIMSGAASTGQFSGTRIGGLGGNTVGPTDLTMDIGGSLLMTGGTAEFNGASIGSTLSSPAQPNIITINTVGDVILNPGTAAGARIGSSTSSAELALGPISITAGGKIELNGNSAAAPTAIRTLGNVTLSAGTTISEGSHGWVEAGSLTTSSTGTTSLAGPNHVATFNATSTGGSVSLSNTGVLDVTGLVALNDATITNIGDVTVSGTWTAGGTSTITVGSDILLNAPLVSSDVVLTANDGDILQTETGSITAGSVTTVSSGETRLAGSNDVDVFSAQAGDMTITGVLAFDTVNLDVTGSLRLLGGSASGSAAQITADGLINVSVGGNLELAGGSGDGAFARILGYSDINLTVGGFLTLNAGSGQGAWARIQTASRDSVIYLNFPNLTSGGYFVNGVEGLLRDGKTGLLSENGVAAPDHQLITTYGEQ